MDTFPEKLEPAILSGEAMLHEQMTLAFSRAARSRAECNDASGGNTRHSCQDRPRQSWGCGMVEAVGVGVVK